MESCLNPVSSSVEFIATRASLLGRLKDWGDQESWQEFFNTYWRLIYSVALKAGLTDTEAQDVLQETLVTVAKKIGQFKSDPALGSFKGWLLLITRRRIADQFAKRGKLQRAPDIPATSNTAPLASGGADDSTRTSTIERVADPATFNLDACWEQQWQANLLRAATEKVKSQISPKQFQMFELYVLREWPVRKVAATLDVNVGQVYLAKHRVARLLKIETQKLERSHFVASHFGSSASCLKNVRNSQ
jgi:RNA polymerase sigma factor (sigma-70 family)